MKRLIMSVMAVALTIVGLGVMANYSPAAYADEDEPSSGGTGSYYCVGSGTWVKDLQACSDFSGNQANKTDLMKTVNTIINVIIGIVGFVAVAMMILGGVNFVTSQGDTNKVTKARNTILYGVVGLIVAILAFAIVNFVLSSVFSGTPEDEPAVFLSAPSKTIE